MDKKVVSKAKTPFDTKKLSLLVVIVDHGESDVFIEYFMSLESNVQLTMLANGTVSREIKNLLGLNELKKDVVFSVLQEEKMNQAFEYIETRFRISPRHKGIAFSIKITSLIGVSVYKILSNTVDLVPNGGK